MITGHTHSLSLLTSQGRQNQDCFVHWFWSCVMESDVNHCDRSSIPCTTLVWDTCFEACNVCWCKCGIHSSNTAAFWDSIHCNKQSKAFSSPNESWTSMAVTLQACLRPDVQHFQSGSYVNWTLSNGTVASATNTTGHPLHFPVNLQNQTIPTFLTGPNFTAAPVCQFPAALPADYTNAAKCFTTQHMQISSPLSSHTVRHCGTALLMIMSKLPAGSCLARQWSQPGIDASCM